MTCIDAVFGGGQDREKAQRIFEACCTTFGVKPNEFFSTLRSQHVAFARQVGMYLVRRETGLSFPAIGALMGRDHSSVIHGCNLIADRVKRETSFGWTLDLLLREIQS